MVGTSCLGVFALAGKAMPRRLTAVLIGLAAAGAAPGTSLPIPATVSPGGTREVMLTADRCPTFSWGAVPGASSYELAVYRVGEDGVELQRVLSQGVSAPARSWTPALDRCLEHGPQYAWSLRAVGPTGKSEWSPTSRFQVVSRPSKAAFLAALAVLERHFGRQRQAGEAAAAGAIGGPWPYPGASETAPNGPGLATVSGAPVLEAYGDTCCDGRHPSAYSAWISNTISTPGVDPDVLALELPATDNIGFSDTYIGFFDWDPAANKPRLIGRIGGDEFTGSAKISGWTRVVGSTRTCKPPCVGCTNNTCTERVSCPLGGQMVLSGGHEVVSGDLPGVMAVDSYAKDLPLQSWPDTWEATLHYTGASSVDWRVVAICAEVW